MLLPARAKVLIIKPHWSAKIFEGDKIIEIRGDWTHHRGDTYVSESGSRFITGVFELWACEGPLTQERWEELRCFHRVVGGLPYESTYAWHVRRARRVAHPVPCGRTTQQKWVTYTPVGNARWYAW